MISPLHTAVPRIQNIITHSIIEQASLTLTLSIILAHVTEKSDEKYAQHPQETILAMPLASAITQRYIAPHNASYSIESHMGGLASD